MFILVLYMVNVNLAIRLLSKTKLAFVLKKYILKKPQKHIKR